MYIYIKHAKNIPGYSTTASEFETMKLLGPLRRMLFKNEMPLLWKKNNYRDSFFKTHVKELKVTTPNIIFLKWTEFE